MARLREESRIREDFLVKQSVYWACGRRCTHCGKPLEMSEATLEHVIPLNKGGKNEERNYAVLCRPCNKAKSDYIMEPIGYYKYAPEAKRKALQELFDEYLDAVDWLSHDNLFRTDSFDVQPGMPVRQRGGRRILFFPTTVHIERVNEQTAFDWLFYYSARLRQQEKELIVHSPDSIMTPYYLATHAGTDLALISVFVQKTDSKTCLYDGNEERNVIVFDIFANPDLKYSEEHMTGLFIQNFMRSVFDEISATLRQKSHGKITAIECLTRSPISDKIMYRALTWGQNNPSYRPFPLFQGYVGEVRDGQDEDDLPTILYSDRILFQGNNLDVQHVAKEQGMTMKEFMMNPDISSLQSSIDERLTESKEIQDAPDPYAHRVTKSDKKKRTKKKKRHNK